METHIYIKYAIFIMIVTMVSSAMYGLPYVEGSSIEGTALNLPSFSWNGFVWGNILSTILANMQVGLSMFLFSYNGLPSIIAIPLGAINVIMMIVFLLDFIHGFI